MNGSSWHPPCSGRYGRMGSEDAIVCERQPEHKGPHHSRSKGIRWAQYGSRPGRCTWAACKAPDRQDTQGTHVCPDGEGERLSLLWWPKDSLDGSTAGRPA